MTIYSLWVNNSKPIFRVIHRSLRLISTSERIFSNSDMIDRDDNPSIKIPVYQEKTGETLKITKARLLYQSRKRGMLENGLLLSTFAAQNLAKMTEQQTKLYDKLINQPSNDWEIYYWATGIKETPAEYNNEIMDMLKKHVQNLDRQTRFRQPDL